MDNKGAIYRPTLVTTSTKAVFFLLLTFLCLSACSGTSVKHTHDTTIIEFSTKKGKPLPAKEWHCYNFDSGEEIICLPSKWSLAKQDRFLMMSFFNSKDSNSYFVVSKLDKREIGLNSESYLKQAYSELTKDNRQHFDHYQTIKYTYADKVVFNSTFYTKVNNQPYITYSEVFEKGQDLFEVALKSDSVNAEKHKENYHDILYNLYYRNKLVFTLKDSIKAIDQIDISKL